MTMIEECGKAVQEELIENETETVDDAILQEEIAAEENPNYIKMDYSLITPEERIEKIKEIVAKTPSDRLTENYLEKLADYVIFAAEKLERKERTKNKISEKSDVLTENRSKRINVRETSFEGLVGKLENGEDGIYNMITNDKNVIFQPKTSITEQDLAEIPPLKELHDEILKVEELAKHARGKKAYALKKQLIQMRQDQYVIKGAYKKPIYCMNLIRSIPKIDLGEEISIDEDGNVFSDGLINFYNEKHVSALLCHYAKIKEDAWDKLHDDAKWMMEDLDNLVDKALKEKYPMYYDLVIYKIDGRQNAEIQEMLYNDYGIKHSVEYLSSLWRNKIPKLIVEQAKNDYLIWYYTYQEKGYWKTCSKCNCVKLGHNNFFSKNKTSKDNLYSICKECRNKKKNNL